MMGRTDEQHTRLTHLACSPRISSTLTALQGFLGLSHAGPPNAGPDGIPGHLRPTLLLHLGRYLAAQRRAGRGGGREHAEAADRGAQGGQALERGEQADEDEGPGGRCCEPEEVDAPGVREEGACSV